MCEINHQDWLEIRPRVQSHGQGNKLSQTVWREKYKLSFSKDKWTCAQKIFANLPPQNLLE